MSLSSEIQALQAKKDAITSKIRNESDPVAKNQLISKAKEISLIIKDLQPQKVLTEKQIQKKKNILTKICDNCKKEYETSGQSRIPIVYCRDCRVVRGKDILEWVTVDSFKCFSEDEQSLAEQLLKENPSQFRLDLHKTLDTIDPKETLPDHTCCVSYVGSLTQTRIGARLDIQNRIKTGQLKFGVLVFKRGSHRDPEAANRYQEVGSKAWFNRCVPNVKGKVSVFVDDSNDHVLSVKSVGIQSQRILGRQNLLRVIQSLDVSRA